MRKGNKPVSPTLSAGGSFHTAVTDGHPKGSGKGARKYRSETRGAGAAGSCETEFSKRGSYREKSLRNLYVPLSGH